MSKSKKVATAKNAFAKTKKTPAGGKSTKKAARAATVAAVEQMTEISDIASNPGVTPPAELPEAEPTDSTAAAVPLVRACPKGGECDWDEVADDGIFCLKCHEPQEPVAAPKKTRTRKASGEAKVPRVSALNEAAKLLAETNVPMGTKEMIDALAASGAWTSPGGKTPWATLYSAILTEITKKGADSRFIKAERGKFAIKA